MVNSLEDRTFGIDAATENNRTVADATAAYLFPVAVTMTLMTVVLYSICKGIEYQELFSSNARCRTGLLASNALAIAVAAVLVGRSVHDEACKRALSS